jgi:hypothetical protein
MVWKGQVHASVKKDRMGSFATRVLSGSMEPTAPRAIVELESATTPRRVMDHVFA